MFVRDFERTPSAGNCRPYARKINSRIPVMTSDTRMEPATPSRLLKNRNTEQHLIVVVIGSPGAAQTAAGQLPYLKIPAH
jgi:hypothetical protein